MLHSANNANFKQIPEHLEDIVDSSGFRLHHTAQLREYDIGIIRIGNSATSLGHLIPPGIVGSNVGGYCPSNCTNDGMLPEEGVTVFGSLLHSHTIGTSMQIRHIRDGQELAPIDRNQDYDFDFQVKICHCLFKFILR